MTAAMVEGNRVTLLHDGAQCLGAMLEAIARAQREILLEMYWFDSDDTGQRFAAALSERARQGLRVCVSYDAIGSLEADRAMFARMREAGCQVVEWNPVRFARFSFARLNRRNHRKMLLADGRLGLTGGVNLSDLWAAVEHGGHDFRDDMIQIEGPAVAAMRAIFLAAFPGAEALPAVELPACAVQGTCRVSVLANDRFRDRRVIERAYIERFRRARERILITNSYFIPNRRIRHLLARAAARGVEVKVLLPGESDVPAAAHATHYLYASLLRRGIELYHWGQSVLHSKTAVVDGTWCTIGTHNLDYRSWAYNLEINIAVEDAAVAGALERRMRQDLAVSVRVDPNNWRFRSLGQRLLEFFFYQFRRIL